MTSLFTIVQRDDKNFLPSFSPLSLFFFLQQSSIKDHRKETRRVYFFDRANVEGVPSTRKESREGGRKEGKQEGRKEGRKCCRFFKILSSASSSTLLHPLISVVVVFASRSMDKNRSSKPKAIRIQRHTNRADLASPLFRYYYPYDFNRSPRPLERRGKVEQRDEKEEEEKRRDCVVRVSPQESRGPA